MSIDWHEIAQDIKRIHSGKEFVALHEPTFGKKELENVTECIKSGWVSSVGEFVEKFEKKLADYSGVKYAIAVVNGTAALHIALKVVGVQPNDEVFMPALTFIATANSVSYLQAIPHFVDVSDQTLGLDPVKLEEHIQKIGITKNGQLINRLTGRIIRAVVPMHTFGHSIDLDPLIELCERYNLVLVEDAAESLGSYYKGRPTGGFGRTAAISFNGNKIITTGGGGAILTNDANLANYAKHITTTAKVPHSWDYCHDEIGFNYRLPNINAALGCAQLEKIDEFIDSKRKLTYKYEQLFSNINGVSVFKEPPLSKSNYWLQTILIDEKKFNRDKILSTLNELGVMARPIWKPLHELKMYNACPKADLTVTEFLKLKIINLPSTPIIGEGKWE